MKTITISGNGAVVSGDFIGDAGGMPVSWPGGVQAKTGGGHLVAPAVVRAAGSADSEAVLYDGNSTDGTVLATIGLGRSGPMPMANASFVNGLFVSVSGTAAATFDLCFE